MTKENLNSYLQICKRVLKQHAARLTQPRLAVATCLNQSDKPLSPREVLEGISANKNLPEVDKVTVYRILEAFLDYGLVHQVGPSGEYVPCTHVSCAKGFHVLTRCTECGATNESHLPEELADSFKNFLEKSLKFSPTEHVMQIDGCCKKCI
ncbi:MAG: Fur family transcriptional regulator [Bdellovibrionota bacterium]